MDTPITPHGEVNASHPVRGPKCFCEEPTILKILNGRKVYVCYKYPNHHCRACCPADVMLLDTDNRPSKSSCPAAAAVQPSGSAHSLSPMSEDVPIVILLSPDEEQLALANSTTPSNNVLSNSRTPAAPSKRSTPSSASSRIYDGGAARSLTPLFNGCAAAASRAQQLGGRFAKRRPQALAVALMQRQMSGSSSQERGIATATPAMSGSVSRKRVREEPPRHALTTAAPSLAAAFRINKSNDPSGSVGRSAMSVQTVSRGPEVRKAWNGNRGGLHNSISNGQQQQQQQNQN